MSAHKEAAQQLIESELACPQCGEVNIPGKPPKVKLDGHRWEAACDTCGRGGRVADFQQPPKEKRCS